MCPFIQSFSLTSLKEVFSLQGWGEEWICSSTQPTVKKLDNQKNNFEECNGFEMASTHLVLPGDQGCLLSCQLAYYRDQQWESCWNCDWTVHYSCSNLLSVTIHYAFSTSSVTPLNQKSHVAPTIFKQEHLKWNISSANVWSIWKNLVWQKKKGVGGMQDQDLTLAMNSHWPCSGMVFIASGNGSRQKFSL